MANSGGNGDQREFRCEHCNGKILVPANLPATTGPCPHCQKTITSPGPDLPPGLDPIFGRPIPDDVVIGAAGAVPPPLPPSGVPDQSREKEAKAAQQKAAAETKAAAEEKARVEEARVAEEKAKAEAEAKAAAEEKARVEAARVAEEKAKAEAEAKAAAEEKARVEAARVAEETAKAEAEAKAAAEEKARVEAARVAEEKAKAEAEAKEAAEEKARAEAARLAEEKAKAEAEARAAAEEKARVEAARVAEEKAKAEADAKAAAEEKARVEAARVAEEKAKAEAEAKAAAEEKARVEAARVAEEKSKAAAEAKAAAEEKARVEAARLAEENSKAAAEAKAAAEEKARVEAARVEEEKSKAEAEAKAAAEEKTRVEAGRAVKAAATGAAAGEASRVEAAVEPEPVEDVPATEPDSQATDSEVRPVKAARKVPVVPLVVMFALVAIAAAAAFLVPKLINRPTDPIVVDNSAAEALKEEEYLKSGWEADARRVLREFLSAGTIEEKARHAIRGGEVLGEMGTYYGDGRIDDSDTPESAFSVYPLNMSDKKRGIFMLIYDRPPAFELGEFFTPLAPLRVKYQLQDPDMLLTSVGRMDNFTAESLQVQALFKRGPDGLKIDWETFVQTKYRTLRDFIDLPEPGRKQVFRVIISETVPETRNAPAGHRTYLIADPSHRSEDSVRVYVPGDSDIGRAFSILNWRGTKDGRVVAKTATIELEWSDEATPRLSVSRFICWEFLGVGGEAVEP